MKRIFIAINLPTEIKEKIAQIVERINIEKILDDSSFRWASPDNWHLTISFLGYQPDEAIGPILEAIKETAEEFPAPTVEFEKIIMAPPDKPARMVWLTGSKETSKSLGGIRSYLEDLLIKNGVRFRTENRPFNAHLTLARFQPNELPGYPINQLSNHPIHQLSFTAGSLDLMESHLKRSGAEYEVLSELTFLAR
jgi:2'-5' RNA ligase